MGRKTTREARKQAVGEVLTRIKKLPPTDKSPPRQKAAPPPPADPHAQVRKQLERAFGGRRYPEFLVASPRLPDRQAPRQAKTARRSLG